MKNLTTWVVAAAALLIFAVPVHSTSSFHHANHPQQKGIHITPLSPLNPPDWLE